MMTSPSCNCCGVAPPADECGDYEASDANEYGVDTFDTLDGGWTDASDTAVSMGVSGGHLVCTKASGAGVYGLVYRNAALTSGTLKVILETNIYMGSSAAVSVGIFIGTILPTSFWSLDAVASGGSWDSYVVRIAGTPSSALGPTPVDGDKLTIKIRETVGGYRLCAYVNEAIVYGDTGLGQDTYLPFSLPDDIPYGLFAAFSPFGTGNRGEHDNFSIHVGNP